VTAATALPAILASRYLPVRVIGRGGMGVVYEVVHAHTGEHLALKLLREGGDTPTDLNRFKREARAPAKIKSPNVVHVLDADTAPELNDAPFLVMELLEGLDLEQAATRSPPSPATVVDWLRQIAPALDKAHRIGIVHRDLKPENLFLSNQEGRPPIVKILDFGIAKITEDGSTATASGQLLGTPRYMAPEQATQNSKITGATDLYALGLVAYRLLAGESYYRGPMMSVLAELLHGAPSTPSARHPHLGAGFDAWFLQACHRDPACRFASAVQQIEALAAALHLPGAPRSADEPAPSLLPALDAASRPIVSDASPLASPRPPSKRRVVMLVGAALALVAAIFASRPFFPEESAPISAQEADLPKSPPSDPRHDVPAPMPVERALPPAPSSAAPPVEPAAPIVADSPEKTATRVPDGVPPAAPQRKPARARRPSATEPASAPDPYKDQK
jgi:eukaryotic-like serine/threonine-protein kinase